MNRLTILIYHRVLPEPDRLREGLVDQQWFERQLDVVGRIFDVLPLSEAVRRLRERSLRRPSICITFDDGYADNEEVALGLLLKRGMPASFFVASGYLQGGCMWNDQVFEAVRAVPGAEVDFSHLGLGAYRTQTIEERAAAAGLLIDKLKYLEPCERDRTTEALVAASGVRLPKLMMSPAQVRSLHRAGMEIGGHTVSHPILTRLGREDARREIRECKSQLEAIIQAPIRMFAYPNGRPKQDYDLEHANLVREAGFELAVSTATGVAVPSSQPFQLPRLVPWPRSSLRLGVELLRNLFRCEYEQA